MSVDTRLKYINMRVTGTNIATPTTRRVLYFDTFSESRVYQKGAQFWTMRDDGFPFDVLAVNASGYTAVYSAMKYEVTALFEKCTGIAHDIANYQYRFITPNHTNDGFNLRIAENLYNNISRVSVFLQPVVQGVTSSEFQLGLSMYENNLNNTIDCTSFYRSFVPLVVKVVKEDGAYLGFGCLKNRNAINDVFGQYATFQGDAFINYHTPPASAADGTSAFPYPSTDYESGDGMQDDTSDDIDDPDDVWTDLLTNYLASSNGFATVYHMTPTQMGMFSAELWDDNLITQLKHRFNNPLDAIVSIMALPFNVGLSGTQKNIVLGGLEMTSKGYVVPNVNQWIDCGSLELPEYWGSFLDYKCQNVSIYLPFVGFRALNAQYVVGGTISVKYRVDILTGAFLCVVRYEKNGRSQILDRFNGNMGMQVPISSQQHTGVVQMLSSAVGTATNATVGNYLGATLSAGSALASGLERSVKTVGNFSCNVGFLDNRTPYLVVERSNAQTPNGYNKYLGIPSRISKKLSELHGYTKVYEVELDGSTSITDNELREIYTLLKNGVVLP